jgi:hypothetical protein
MARRKLRSQSSRRKVPKVRLVRPTGRPFQLRYKCPIEKREIRISTGGRDEEEAERLKAELEAKLVLGMESRHGNGEECRPENGDIQRDAEVLRSTLGSVVPSPGNETAP